VENNGKFAEIRAGSLSHLAASPLDFDLADSPHALVLQCEPARRLMIRKSSHLSNFVELIFKTSFP